MPGTRLGPYEVSSLLGTGGMGEVYRARDSRLSRDVAVKVLSPQRADRPEALARFQQEARLVATVSHPNILALFDIGEESGVFYAVTELLEGMTLQHELGVRPLPMSKALDYGIQIAAGLAAAHDKGIIHRDLKPGNIFITSDGRVKILDFGLARWNALDEGKQDLSTLDQNTKPGTVLGTVGYMSPEQARGKHVDDRSDIFSLGAVLYEMITGRAPFVRETSADSLSAILHSEPDEPSRLRSEVSPSLDRVVLRCLEKKPAERFQSARDLGFALETAAALKSTALPRQETPSIAVLPFVNMSPDPEQDYFCEGIAEEIIHALTRLDNVRVTSRTSAFQFRGKSQDLRKVGDALKVKTVLEGGVRSAGRKLRVTAQLVGVEDGSTLWSERYDREVEDVFAIQDDISASIVGALRLRLAPTAAKSSSRPATNDLEAYQLFLKGQHAWYKRDPGSVQKAALFFERAVERDPAYVAALVGVASAYTSLNFAGCVEPRVAVSKARSAIGRAASLDPGSVEVLAALGHVSFGGLDAARGEAQLRQALAVNPSHVLAHIWLGWVLMHDGRAEEAIGLLQHAQELDPLSPYVQAAMGHALLLAHRPKEAAAQLKMALELDASFLLTLYGLGAAQVQLGRHEEGIRVLERAALRGGRAPYYLAWLGWGYGSAGRRADAGALLRELHEWAKTKYVAPAFLSAIHAALGELDRAFEWLEQGREQGNATMMLLRWPPWSPLHDDARYRQLEERLRRNG